MMTLSALSWLILVVVLSVSTFGASIIITLILGIISLVIGIITSLYVQRGVFKDVYFQCNLLDNNYPQVHGERTAGLLKFTHSMRKAKDIKKTDQRVTGSDLIDSSLQEIFGYIIRDYVSPWYSLISSDKEFLENGIHKTAQNVAVNISNRVKEIDWLPFLTTKLVDDAATHLRLFRQARAKVKTQEKPKSPKGSPKRSHKRNKSETDVSWYYGSNISDNTTNATSLEQYFFDLECKMENNLICRNFVCTDTKKESEFLSELTELLLYILLPDEDFQCKPICLILKELFTSCILTPFVDMISDPDYINQTLLWLCFRVTILPTDTFLTTLRITDNCDELKYTKDVVLKEIQQLRSRDSGGESDVVIKQQLSSLHYLIKVVDNRMAKLQNTDQNSYWNQPDYSGILGDCKPLKLPLDAILKNNVALSYFIDYVTNIGQQSYLFFYLNIEGWKVTAEQQISNIQINKMKGINENESLIYDKLRETAYNIYDQYLGEKSPIKLQIHPVLVETLFFKISNTSEQPTELWFDEIQKWVYNKMQNQADFLPGFEHSTSYLRLLAELDFFTQPNLEEDAISLSSLDDVEPQCDLLTVSAAHKGKHTRSYSDITDIASINKTQKLSEFQTQKSESYQQFDPINDTEVVDSEEDYSKLKVGNFTLSVDIIETGLMSDKGKTFGIYAMQVTKLYDTGFLEQWHIYRRYSDFHDLHTKIKEKFVDLSRLPFPGKKTFHNMDRIVLERRMRMLNAYMQEVCRRTIVDSHVGLRPLLLTFTELGDYDRATASTSPGHIIRSGIKNIKNMPEQLITTMDEVVGGFTKVFNSKHDRVPVEASKVGAGLDTESDDNIPLRIMLLLMDEVFDLKSRNQWLRRRIVTLLRQIIRTMFGDIVNRRIVDYVSLCTSPRNVAHYLHILKDTCWPNGLRADKQPRRSEAVRSRTRVAAKVALLTTLSDELKHIIGSETTRRGLLTVFELFQRPVLNRRLVYVLIEGVISTLFPEKNINEIFQKLYANSRRNSRNV